jgi:hypothetical protein
MWGFVEEWLELEKSSANRRGESTLPHWILRGWGHPGSANPKYDLEGLLTILQDLADQDRPTGTKFGIELGIASLVYPYNRARYELDRQGFMQRGSSSGRFREWFTTGDALRDFVLSYESNREWVHQFVPSESRALFESLTAFLVERLQRFSLARVQQLFIPFAEFLLDQHRVAVCFTLNYDLTVERALGKGGWELDRGFGKEGKWQGLHFQPKGEKTVILGKLHGSLDWRTDKRGVVVADDVESSQPLVVYPIATKQLYRHPFFALIADFGRALERADVLVTIGYSLRDAAIASIISHHVVASGLGLVVVGPSMTESKVREMLFLDEKAVVKTIQARWEGPSTIEMIDSVLATMRSQKRT